MPGKSATKCYSPGNCKFSIHFMRRFDTGDANDWELFGGVNQIFDTVGYFSSQTQKAQSDEQLIELGATSLLSASAAIVAGLLALSF